MNLRETVQHKERLCVERDLCAELYNVWITKLYETQDNPEKYKTYMNMINNMEPYTQMLKEEIRECNRVICELEGVDSIGETNHVYHCVNTHGFDAPNQ